MRMPTQATGSPCRGCALFSPSCRELRNRDYTIVGRLAELRTALRIMVPDRNFRWLTAPGGVSVRSRLPMERHQFEVPELKVLFDWGCRMIEEALALGRSRPRRRQVKLRDGVMLALAASRGMRLRTLTGLRLGVHLLATSDGFRLVLESEDLKNRRVLEYKVAKRLVPGLRRYLAVERMELLAGHTSDFLWVNWGGEPLALRGVDKRFRWCSEKEFDTAFGSHRCRHSIGTTAPMKDSGNPGVAPAMLGITVNVNEESYNRADRAHAASCFQDDLMEERRQTEALGRRFFES